MKNIIRTTSQLLLCGTLLLSTSGCEQFLEEPDKSNFTMENYFTKPEHAESVVNASYESLRSVTGWAGVNASRSRARARVISLRSDASRRTAATPLKRGK